MYLFGGWLVGPQNTKELKANNNNNNKKPTTLTHGCWQFHCNGTIVNICMTFISKSGETISK